MSFVLIIAAAAAWGALALRLLGFRPGIESWVFRLFAGLCLCGVAAMALGSYSLAWVQVVFSGMGLGG